MQQNITSTSEFSSADLKKVFTDSSQYLNQKFLNLFAFVLKRWYIFLLLFVAGVVLGYFSDKHKSYAQDIIVIPNFSSVDYLYEKINVFNSKIKEKDSLYFSKYHFIGFKNIGKIEIKPIIDIYKLGQSSAANLEMIKLMTEDISMDEIINGDINRKAYIFHQITISTKKKVEYNHIIKPFLDYLNDTEYFTQLQKIAIENVKYRLIANDSSIVQINNVINNFSDLSREKNHQSQLVYYNENTQINDLFHTKNDLNYSKGALNQELVNYQNVIKDVSIAENKIIKKPLPDKVTYPLLLIALYLLTIYFLHLIKKVRTQN